MLSKPDALKTLRAFFKKNRLAMLPDIYALQPQRTNNILEQFFRDLKRVIVHLPL